MPIRRLAAPDAARFRALRLDALLRHPEAFGDSHAEAAARPPGAFESLIAQPSPAAILGAFEAGDRLVGMAGLAVPRHAKQGHKGLVWGVYVTPAARGRGLGQALLATLVQAARDAGLEQLQLSVTTGNAAAMTVYAGIGFRTYGLECRALRLGPGDYRDEALMVLDLRG